MIKGPIPMEISKISSIIKDFHHAEKYMKRYLEQGPRLC